MQPSSFMKKKQEHPPHKKQTNHKTLRLDTEAANPLVAKKQKSTKKPNKIHKQQNQYERPQKTYKIQRCLTTNPVNESASTVYKSAKTSLSIKQLTKTMWQLKNNLQTEYDELLSGKITQSKYKQISQLLATNYFRFRKTTFPSALEQFNAVIQGLELLISKLTNNEKLSETVLIRNEQDFVLFFKFFFSKPYTLINLPAVRKVVKLLWDQFIFPSLNSTLMTKNLKLWIFGIAAPLNPSMNKLHKMCTQLSEEISRLVNHKSNQYVYIGINDSDTLCLTPLMVAAIASNTKAIEKLIKNGADIHCCPLTVNSKVLSESTEAIKSGNKILIKKQFGFKERKQPDPIEILKVQKKNEEIAQILCWQNFYELKKLRKDTEISDLLEMFPDCCFQIDWKQYRGMLCFKELPQDIVSIYKNNHSLRIDYHIQSGVHPPGKAKGHYSLIFTAQPKKENTFFMISHYERLIRNLFEDKDIKSIKQKYTILMKQGNAYSVDVSDLKTIYFPQDRRLTATYQTYYQNYTKTPQLPKFENQSEYFRAVVDAELINYVQLQKDELKAILNQSIVKVDKSKPKYIEQQLSVDANWSESQSLNLSHLQLILKIVQVAMPQSVLFHKLKLIMQTFQDPIFRSHKFHKKLPIRCKIGGSDETNIQCEIKNIRYCKLQDSIFKLQVKAKQMKFEQVDEPVDLSHLQDTMYMDEMYSIRASRFIGNSQKMLQLQEKEASQKFEELLRLEGIWSNDQQQQK